MTKYCLVCDTVCVLFQTYVGWVLKAVTMFAIAGGYLLACDIKWLKKSL
jgi:hypothetical protein